MAWEVVAELVKMGLRQKPDPSGSLAATPDDPKTTRWYDSRAVIFVLWPFGALVFTGLTVLFASVPLMLYFTEREAGGDAIKKAVMTGMFIFFCLICLYICICYYQALFIELRKKFIAWKVVYLEGEFRLGGYFFKRARFKEGELASVEQFQVSPRFIFFKNTLLTIVNQKTRCDYNLKVSLKDGRIFYLPGELDRLTLGETDQGDKLTAFLEERMRANRGA